MTAKKKSTPKKKSTTPQRLCMFELMNVATLIMRELDKVPLPKQREVVMGIVEAADTNARYS
jgi:hypothetical protein